MLQGITGMCYQRPIHDGFIFLTPQGGQNGSPTGYPLICGGPGVAEAADICAETQLVPRDCHAQHGG